MIGFLEAEEEEGTFSKTLEPGDITFDRDTVTRFDGLSIESQFTGEKMEPVALSGGRWCQRLAGLQMSKVNLPLGTDCDGIIATIGRGDQGEGTTGGMAGEIVVMVTWLATRMIWLQPNLKEVNRLIGGGIEFGMLHAVSGGQVLKLACLDGSAISHGVPVSQFTGNDIGKDLHRTMRVGSETLARRDGIVVDHTEASEAAMVRVIVFAKRKSVPGVEPAVVRMEAVGGAADL